MAQIGGDAGGVDDIVEGELVDERAGLEEEGQGLGGVSWHLAVMAGGRTWPMPPEAPRTATGG